MSKQVRCQGVTKRGEPCRSFALPGHTLCYAHAPELAAERQHARQKGGANSGRLRTLRGRRSRLATVPELISFTADVIHDTQDGILDPAVARCVLYGLSIQRQLVEAGDLERRVAALEARMAEK